PQHIEIVDLAQQVLHVLQIVAPGFVLNGQEIFDDVAEALDADAQRVEADLRAVAEGAIVQVAGGGPAFEGEVLEYRAAGANAGGSLGQGLAPLAPFFAVEFAEGSSG